MPTRASISNFRPLALFAMLPVMAFACQVGDSEKKNASTTAPTASPLPAPTASPPPQAFTDSLQSLGSDSSVCVALGDIDGDGDIDAWAGGDAMDPTQTWINDGKGRYTKGQEFRWSDMNQISSVALADLDGDGDLDAWLACNNGLNKAHVPSG